MSVCVCVCDASVCVSVCVIPVCMLCQCICVCVCVCLCVCQDKGACWRSAHVIVGVISTAAGACEGSDQPSALGPHGGCLALLYQLGYPARYLLSTEQIISIFLVCVCV